MTIESNKAALIRHFEEVLNQGNLPVVDEIYTDDYTLDAPVSSDGQSRNRSLTQGREQLKQRVTLFRSAFPDIHFTTDEIVAEGNSVVVQYTYRGTHQGVFAGINPSGRSIDITGILIAHMLDGRIQEAVSVFDSAQLMKQLGN
jgi:steroid delta-isomerase-like uncharacterized protein